MNPYLNAILAYNSPSIQCPILLIILYWSSMALEKVPKYLFDNTGVDTMYVNISLVNYDVKNEVNN